MSFGYSIGDAALLANLAWQTFQNARQACGEHDELTREVRSIHRVLQRLHEELSSPNSLLHRADESRRKELNELGEGCERVLTLMNSIVSKYNALSDKKKSGKKLWQKIRFGNGEMKDLSEIRQKMSTYTAALLMCINLASLGSQGRVERELGGIGGDLEGIRGKVDWIAARLAATSVEGTVWTDYVGDDRAFWRELRRGLVKDGYSSEVLHKHKHLIKDYVKELGNRGVFDEHDEEHGADRSSISDERPPSSNPDTAIRRPSSSPSLSVAREEEAQMISNTDKDTDGSLEDEKSRDISTLNNQHGFDTRATAGPSLESNHRVSLREERVEPRPGIINSISIEVTDPGEKAADENKKNELEEKSEDAGSVYGKGKSNERQPGQKLQMEQSAESTEILDPDIGSSSDDGPHLNQTLKFTDALGRKFTFPFEMVKQWADFKNYIDQAFIDEPAIRNQVQRQQYDLQGPNGVGIPPQEWQSVVQPGWRVVMTLWYTDSSVSKQRTDLSQTQTQTIHGNKQINKKQVEDGDEFEVLVRQMTGSKESYIVNPRTTSLELKQLISKRHASETDWINLFNHVDRRSVPDDVILWDRGVRQGSLLEVLYPIWPKKPKIDDDLILATIKKSIEESRRRRRHYDI